MRIIFCNIEYMNKYIGKIEQDAPTNTFNFVDSYVDCDEKYNFLNYNGYCYGSVNRNGCNLSLSRIDDITETTTSLNNVTVVWTAKYNEKNVIVGWYKNAKVYKENQSTICTPISGIEHSYYVSAKSEDCYLLPENKRIYEMKGINIEGDIEDIKYDSYNVWYADSEIARKEIIPNIIGYINSYNDKRINAIPSDFIYNEGYENKLTDEELNKANDLFNDGEYMEFLPYAYRAFNENPSADNAFYIAISLRNLCQFNMSLEWYNKVLEIEGLSWDVLSPMPYLYAQCNNPEAAIQCTYELLKMPESNVNNVRCELYSILVDNYYYLGKIADAIAWLNNIINESDDSGLVNHSKEFNSYLESLL